jgi:FixJ family two-component response regulator/signal transduction histidine kinase
MIDIMVTPRKPPASGDRVLIVEADPLITDLIGRQALHSVGYQVQIATDASSAIAKALQWAPDLILIDLHLPGLSGKDLMVALASQGIQAPLIVIAQRGAEADIIQTFRLGAADYLLLPLREAEIVNAVNRVLQQVHDRRERDRLAQQLQQANQEMQARVRELTTIFAVGKAMTSITDPAYLLEKVLDAAIRCTQADVGWFLLRDEAKKPFNVVAEHKLPEVLGIRLNQPWDDGISSLVAMSGEKLAIHGDPLRRFKIAGLGQSALIVPIKVQKTVIGLLVMMRKELAPFGTSEQHLLEALADYASISLVNARLFRALEERAQQMQQMAENAQLARKVNNDILSQVKEELSGSASSVLAILEQISKDVTARWRPDQRLQLNAMQNFLVHISQVGGAIFPQHSPKALFERVQLNLGDLADQSLRRLQPAVVQVGMKLASEKPVENVMVCGDAVLLAQAVDGVVCQVVRMSKPGSLVTLRVEKKPDSAALLSVRSSGMVLEAKDADKLFDETAGVSSTTRFGGLGIQLSLVKDIVSRHNGKICLDRPADKEASIQVKIPTI